MTRLKKLSRSVDGADTRRVLVSLTTEGESGCSNSPGFIWKNCAQSVRL